MPQPTVPLWSTQTNYTTNPDPAAIGQPTKQDPGSLATQGFVHMTRPNPRHFNHLFNRYGGWFTWISTFALDGENGGDYTPNAPINLSNQGLGIFDGAELTIGSTGFVYLNGLGTVTATGQLAFASGAELTLDSGAVADINTGAEVAFNSGSDLTFASGSDIAGTARFGGTSWTWNAPQVLNSTVTNTGAGHRVDRTVTGTDGSVTYSINDYDEILIPVVTDDWTYTLGSSGATDGCRMRFNAWGNTGTKTVAIATPEGTWFLRNVGGGTNTACLDVVYHAGAWHTSNRTPAP